jgi:4-coumarate--CoA ligase
VTEHVLRHAERLADRTAIADGPTGRSYSYADLAGAIGRVAGGLAENGFEKEDVLAILLPNLPEYAIAFHAAATLGGIVTTINPTYTTGEIAFQLRDSNAKLVLTISLFHETARAAAEGTGVDEIFILDSHEGARSFFELLAADPLDRTTDVSASDVVALPYSSGTTGLPKGVELTHGNLVSNLSQTEPLSTVGEEDVVLAVLPFFHIYGMQVLMNGVLFHGAMSVTMPRFDLADFLETIQRHRVTRVALVPPIVVALAKHPMVDEYDLSSLVQIGSGAAPLSAEVEELASQRTGAEVVQGFGLTETSPVTHTALPGLARSGSIGVLVPNTEARVVDPASGEDLGRDRPGELWLRGPQVMKGYLGNPEATEAAFENGWFKTGDIAVVDEDDHWYITDRLKELIKYKGFQVAPAELEAVLLTHEDIADAAVIGVADEDAGEVPKAFVVARSGVSITPEEVMAHVAERVASYKKVRHVEFIDEIPKSLSGKILRRVLRERASTEV